MTSIDTPTGWVRRLVAVILTMTATTVALGAASAPSGAAACSSSSGVSVIVDFGSAGGGVQTACVAGGADVPADQVIASAGFALTWVSRQPGFICRINGVPTTDPCVNTPPPDAYWGIFWSDGKDGTWHYSDFGATGLQVPGGGYIGVSWQSGTRREPGQAATAHPVVTATPTPTPTAEPTSAPTTSGTTAPTNSPTKNPTKNPSKNPTTSPTRTPTKQPTSPPTSTGTTSPPTTPVSPTESSSTTTPSEAATTEPPSESPSSDGTEAPTTSATTEPSTTATESSPSTPSADPDAAQSRTDEDSSRVPTWLTITILVSLLVAIGMSAYAARRRTHH